MSPFETLSTRGQISCLRRLARKALTAYGIRPVRLVPLAHLENTTFRVESVEGDRYVLRIHRTSGSPFHPPRNAAEVASEVSWLTALGCEAGLAVPEPVLTEDGSPLVVAETDGVPGPRICVLFRWRDGRFLDAGLTPSHLERVGAFIARLHDQALGFVPPPGFVRGRVGDLSGGVAAAITSTIAAHGGTDAAATVSRMIDMVEAARRELGEGPAVFGLIHADLHQENFLFRRGRVQAIDFDDCGWGHFAYDLSVTLSELRWRPDYDARRAGLLRGYRAIRPLPAEHESYLEVFHGLRLLQLTLWFLEQRDHPAFADEWEEEVRSGLEELTALTERLAASSR